MTLTIAIDESGNTSEHGTRFFVIAAIITNRSRVLLHSSKLIDNRKGEMKYYNSKNEKIIEILSSISETRSNVIYTVIDKQKYNSKYFGIFGNNLYKAALKDLLNKLFSIYQRIDVRIMIDETSQIKTRELKDLVEINTVNIVSFKKYVSSTNKCIQIADFIAGAIFTKYEYGNDFHYDIFKKIILRP